MLDLLRFGTSRTGGVDHGARPNFCHWARVLAPPERYPEKIQERGKEQESQSDPSQLFSRGLRKEYAKLRYVQDTRASGARPIH